MALLAAPPLFSFRFFQRYFIVFSISRRPGQLDNLQTAKRTAVPQRHGSSRDTRARGRLEHSPATGGLVPMRNSQTPDPSIGDKCVGRRRAKTGSYRSAGK